MLLTPHLMSYSLFHLELIKYGGSIYYLENYGGDESVRHMYGYV